MTNPQETIEAHDPRTIRRVNAAGIVGNILEWYDYAPTAPR